MSHSKNWIVYAAHRSEIGVDIEEIDRKNINIWQIAKDFFTIKELEYIRNSMDSYIAFYEIWIRKEAYVKMFGEGLFMLLNTIDVLEEHEKIKIWSFIIYI